MSPQERAEFPMQASSPRADVDADRRGGSLGVVATRVLLLIILSPVILLLLVSYLVAIAIYLVLRFAGLRAND